jgi:basic amino acid/polyamine antiporter, APA family
MDKRVSDKISKEKKIGLFAATAIVLGNIVGVMIFLTPSTVAKHLPWNGWFMLAWAVGGILALLGALAMGELGAMFPKAGGDYIYIREAYGEKTSFLSGWTSVVITFPGSIAAMAVGICVYQAPELFGAGLRNIAFNQNFGSWYFAVTWSQILAIGLVMLITTVNHLGTRFTAKVQTFIMATPIILMLIAGVAAFFISPAGLAPKAAVSTSGNPLMGFFPALVPIFFAYAGWNVITYIGGEIKNPGKNIPYSLIIGTLLSIGLYLLVLLVFLKGVSASAMPGLPFVPGTAVGRLFGPKAASLLTIVIALAVMGSLNATILAGARISYAMAGHGLAIDPLKKKSKRFGTPVTALWVQAALASILILSGRFEQLIGYTVMVMLIFSTITVGAVIILRIKKPNLKRPYKSWGYPITPIIFMIFSIFVIGFLFYGAQTRTQALWGVAITLLGLPVFYLLKNRSKT